MANRPDDTGFTSGTLDLQTALAESERYRTALGAIHHTASVAAQCPCGLVVASLAGYALTPPVTRIEYWLHCEA